MNDELVLLIKNVEQQLGHCELHGTSVREIVLLTLANMEMMRLQFEGKDYTNVLPRTKV